MIRILTQLAAVLLVMASAPTAQQSTDTPAASKQRGGELLRQVADAIGSTEQIANISSLTHLARVQLINSEEDDTAILIDSIVQVFPFKEIRISTSEDRTQPRQYILSDHSGWRIIGENIDVMTDIDVRNARRALEKHPLNILQAIDSPYYEVTFKGDDSLLGETYYRLDFNTDSDYKFSWYIDPMTNLPRAHTVTLIPDQGFFIIEQYHVVGGIMMPKQEEYRRQNAVVIIDYITQAVNAEFDSSVFERPN